MVEKNHFIDRFGRIVLPAHIRKQMNVGEGKVIHMAVNKNGELIIKAIPARCYTCGGALGKRPHATLTPSTGEKFICYDCATKIVDIFEKGGETNVYDSD